MYKLVSRACQNVFWEVLLQFPSIVACEVHYVLLGKRSEFIFIIMITIRYNIEKRS